MRVSDSRRVSARRFLLLLILFLTFPASLHASEPRFIRHGRAVPSEYIVKLPDDTPSNDVDAIAAALARDYGLKIIRVYRAALPGFHCRASARAAQKLARDTRVDFVEENFTGRIAQTESSCSNSPNGWSLRRIMQRNLLSNPSAYSNPISTLGSGIVAFVLDTGVLASHEQFNNGMRVKGGYDAKPEDPLATGTPDNPCPNDPAPKNYRSTSNEHYADAGHGTAVASILGGKEMGVAPGVTIEPVRVSNCHGEWATTSVLAGLEFVADYDFQQPFRGAVLNMSFEGPRDDVDKNIASPMGSLSIKAALGRVAAIGVVPFTVAGNFPNGGSGNSCDRAISWLGFGNTDPDPHVIVSSGIDITDTRRVCGSTNDPNCGGTQFGYGQCVDLFAPATCVWAAAMESDTAVRSTGRNGTSFASPMSAGVGARLLAEYPLYNGRETSYNLWRMLRDTATRDVVKNPGPASPNRLLYIEALKIQMQPKSITVGKGGTAELSVAATAPETGTLTYQWYRGPYVFDDPHKAVGAGATSATYQAPTDTTGSETYWVKVTHSSGVSADSMPATVTVCDALPATPISISRRHDESDDSWTLSVNDSGGTYEWFIGQPGDTNKRLASTSQPSYNFHPVATNEYWVRATHGSCSVDSINSEMINGICLAPSVSGADQVKLYDPYPSPVPPQPTPSVVVAVAATGSDLEYRWYRVNATGAEVLHTTQAAFRVEVDMVRKGIQEYKFKVAITSGCSGRTVEKFVTIKFVPFNLVRIYIRDPNQPLGPISTLSPNTPFDDQHRVVALPKTTSIYVPNGRGIALTAQPAATGALPSESVPTEAIVEWTDPAPTRSPTFTAAFPHYVPNVTETRELTAKATQDPSRPPSIGGTVSLQPCGLPLIVEKPPVTGTGPVPILMLASDLEDVDVEWYLGDHDDHVAPYAQAHYSSGGVPVWPDKLLPLGQWWARVIAKSGSCAAPKVTEDTETFTVITTCVGRCPGSPGARTRKGTIKVKGEPKSSYMLNSATETVKLTPPSESTGDLYEWRFGADWDPDQPAFSTASHVDVDHQSVGTYWVTTRHSDGTIDDSYPTAIYPYVPGLLTVNVYPSSGVVGAQAQVVFIPQMPANICDVEYSWYQGAGYDDPAKFLALDTDSDHSQLNLYDIPDTATFWLEAAWHEAGQCGTETAKTRRNSQLVTITVTCDPPAGVEISANPGFRVARNELVTMTAIGHGKLLEYSWYDGVLGDKASSTLLTTGRNLYKTFTADSTSLWVEAVDACGNVGNNGTVVYVCKPTITAQPAPMTILRADQTKTLTVAAEPARSGQTLSYQWYHIANRMEEAIPGATSPTLDVTGPSNTYWCQVSGTCTDGVAATVVSQRAEVNVCAPPSIAGLTPSHFVSSNQVETLHVEASGPELAYQWYRGAKGDTSNPIAGATDASYTVLPQSTATYWVRVTSQGECSIDSNAIVLTFCSAPQWNSGPTANPSLVFSGATTTLTVSATATSDAPLHYTWYEVTDLGNVVVGSDQPTYTTEPLTAAKTWFVRITSGTLVSIASPQVTVTVCTIPQTLSAPAGANIAVGQSARLTAAYPTGPYLYRWYSGASGDTSAPANEWTAANSIDVAPTVTTQYWYQLKDGNCVSSSLAATVNVCVPTITTQPAGGMIDAGTPTTLSVAATPAGATYQWYIGESGMTTAPISGATSASLTVSPAVDTSYWVRVTSSCGDRDVRSVDSTAAILTICQKPAINQTTPGSWIARGQSYTLGVAASGTSLTYQWYTGNTGNTSSPIAGATSSNQPVSPANTTNYWARVSGACTPPADSATITVRVCGIPTINTQPQSVSIFSGSSTTLSVTATSATTEPLDYRWYRGPSGDQSNPVGTSSPTFTTPALAANTSYWVLVSSGTCTGAASNAATVSMCAYPQNLAAPTAADPQTASGQSTRITGAAAASGNQYMWFRGASGDTSSPLTAWVSQNYIDVAPTATTQYWYRLQNGSCTSNSAAATVSVCIPTITSQPTGGMVNPGDSRPLSVTAITASSYQWYIGTSGTMTSPIAGATSASLTVTPSVDTNYWVRVTGTCGRFVDSNTVAVTVCQRPAIAGYTPGGWIARGQSYTLGVNATGTGLTYQWYTGTSGNTAAPISGATTASYAVSPQNTTTYWVRVSGACTPPADSQTITVSVCATPSITAQPQSIWIFSGATTTLSVTASEATTSAMSYQWYRGTTGDASNPVGTNSTFTTPALTSTTSYWVRVSCGTCTPADSQTATVSICAYPQVINSSGDVQTSPAQLTRIQASVSNPANQYKWYQGAAGDTSQLISNGWNNYVDVAPTVTTQYWGQVYNDQCVSRTNTITVTVCIPQITQQPQNNTVQPGAPATLTAAANTSGVAYQWYIGTKGTTTSPIPGASGASVTVTPAATTNYWVRATSTCGRTVDSETATVTVCATPAITRQPYNAAPVNPGQASYMDVVATGTNLTYQWYQGEKGDTSNPFLCGGRDACASGTGSSFTINLYSSIRAWVRVSGMCGSTDSNAVWLSVYPSIVSHPASVPNVGYGSTATVSIGAAGAALHYVWKNAYGVPIAVAPDGPTLILSSVTANTTVYCEVTSGVGTSATRTSAPADITLCDGNPYITSMPVYNYGGNCRLVAVNVSNPYNISNYLWYQGARGDTSQPAGSGSQLYVCPATSTQYWVRVVGYDDGRGIDCYTDSQTVTLP